MAQAARRVVANDTNGRLTPRRPRVLELAERSGAITETCRRGGIDRISFHAWKRRFRTHGLPFGAA